LIECFHGRAFVALCPDLIQIKANRLKNVTCFEIDRKQGGCAKYTDVKRQNVVPEFDQLLAQERVIFTFGVKGADDADGITHNGKSQMTDDRLFLNKALDD